MLQNSYLILIFILTLVLLNTVMPWLHKQCRSRFVGFVCGTALFVIQYVNIYQHSKSRVIWLAGCGIFFYSAWQGLNHLCLAITRTSLFKYTENFQIKNSDIFHISAKNIDCGYSLEPPRRGGSNEYPQSMFLAEIRKIMYTPVNPSFTI